MEYCNNISVVPAYLQYPIKGDPASHSSAVKFAIFFHPYVKNVNTERADVFGNCVHSKMRVKLLNVIISEPKETQSSVGNLRFKKYNDTKL